MRSRFWMMSFVTVLLFAGCLGPEGDGDDEDMEDPPRGPEPWALEGSVADCPESIGVLLMEPDALQALLPENFTVRDAGDFFDLGVETGRGVLSFNSLDCDSEAAAEVAVYVNAPGVEGFEPAGYDFYTLGFASSRADLVENLTRVGVAAENATGSATLDVPTPLTATGSADVDGESEMTYALEAVGSAPQPFEFTARFWHVVPTGLVLWQYELPGQEGFAGTLTSCTFPSGSLLAGIAGQEDCTGLQTASLLFSDQAFDFEVRYLPGARAQE